MKTHIHCLELFTKFLEGYISGVEDYTARALLSPEGVVVYEKPNLDNYVSYLKSMNLGPKKVWSVPADGETLFHSLDKSNKLDEVINESDTIVPFVSWENTNQFKEKWGFEDHQWKTQPPEVHMKLENKAHLRDLGKEEWFTEYSVCEDKELAKAGKSMAQKYDDILVRHPKKASGVGAQRVEDKSYFNSKEFDQFLEDFADGNPFLVEEFYDKGQEFSVTWDIKKDGEPELQYWTRQYIDNCIHQGNLISEPQEVFPWDATETINDIKQATRSIVEQFPHYGRIGFDLKVSSSGDWKILECNCRYNGSSYPNFINQQVDSDRCVLMHNIHPDLETFQEVHQIFEQENLDYDPENQKGAFVANPFCLPEKCASVIVAEDPQEAELMLEQVKDKTENR
ncbi:MAG: hypothetical protein ABEJ24_05280 [Candidatus Magasanikbacteria bacterium]